MVWRRDWSPAKCLTSLKTLRIESYVMSAKDCARGYQKAAIVTE